MTVLKSNSQQMEQKPPLDYSEVMSVIVLYVNSAVQQ